MTTPLYLRRLTLAAAFTVFTADGHAQPNGVSA